MATTNGPKAHRPDNREDMGVLPATLKHNGRGWRVHLLTIGCKAQRKLIPYHFTETKREAVNAAVLYLQIAGKKGILRFQR